MEYTLASIKELVAHLNLSGVTKFSLSGLSIEFSQTKAAPQVQATDHKDLFVDESKIPPDLRTDAITDIDKILHWSTGSHPGENESIVGTNDIPLSVEI